MTNTPAALAQSQHKFATAEKSLLVIHSYSEKSPWTQGINSGLREIFSQSSISVRFEPRYFFVDNLKRDSQLALSNAKKALLAEIRSQKQLNAVLVCDDEAADELMLSLKSLPLPVFFTGTNRPEEKLTWLTSADRSHVTGVLEVYPILETLKLLKRLKPDVRRVSILSSKSQSSILAADLIQQQMKKHINADASGIKLGTTSLTSRFSDWKKSAPLLGKQNDALWIPVPYEVLDDNNREVPPEEIGAFLRSVLKIPTIGIISIHTRIGLLAGINVEGKSLGKQSAEQILRYFSGEKIEQIAIENVRLMTLEINETEAKRLHLSIPHDLLGFAHFVKDN